MWIIALGNPVKKYKLTRHNAGHIVADMLLQDSEFTDKNGFAVKKLDCFMNESGQYMRRELKINKDELKNTIILHDDSDLDIGTFKFQYNRGAAGHKGVESIVAAFGANKFWRLRIGVRPKLPFGSPRKKAGEFVLKNFTKKELAMLTNVMPKIKSAIISMLSA